MSLMRMLVVSCDGCGKGGKAASSGDEARAKSQAEGWSCSRTRDLCPACKGADGGGASVLARLPTGPRPGRSQAVERQVTREAAVAGVG